ncbi:MAG: C-GCAxxG-C-C family protein, partial [Coriobacteriia bacterium]|nr:C-GCAxxG-C-C family protein [Coriobacteriia bacterium]
GIGGLEKTCGALCGGLMAIGLFIGQEGIDKDTQERERETAVRLYDAFVEEFATDECQVLKEMAFDNPPADGGRPCCKYVAFCADWIADEFNLKV